MARRAKVGKPKKPRRTRTSSRALRPAKKADTIRTSGSAKQRPIEKPDPIARLVAASAEALALPIDPAWRADIEHNVRLILTHAALVDQFSLPDEIEPAPVFRA